MLKNTALPRKVFAIAANYRLAPPNPGTETSAVIHSISKRKKEFHILTMRCIVLNSGDTKKYILGNRTFRPSIIKNNEF